MTTGEQQTALHDLRKRVEDEHTRMPPIENGRPRASWFWPEDHDGKGFLGTAPIFVVGLNPSWGYWRSATDDFLYRCLNEEALSSAHLTDVFKTKSTRNGVPLLIHCPPELLYARGIIEEETKIVQPRVVLVMGIDTLNVLRGLHLVVSTEAKLVFPVQGRDAALVIPTVHPAATRYPERTKERQDRFRRDAREARLALDRAEGEAR